MAGAQAHVGGSGTVGSTTDRLNSQPLASNRNHRIVTVSLRPSSCLLLDVGVTAIRS